MKQFHCCACERVYTDYSCDLDDIVIEANKWLERYNLPFVTVDEVEALWHQGAVVGTDVTPEQRRACVVYDACRTCAWGGDTYVYDSEFEEVIDEYFESEPEDN